MSQKIILYPDPILRQKSANVDKIGKKDLNLIQKMKNVILFPPTKDGVETAGISAPQLGINKKIIAINYKQIPLIMINPVVVCHFKEKRVDFEGCLSLPNKFGLVERFQEIKVKFQDESLEKKQLNCANFLARVVQHEVDHLEGILFIDKVIGETKTLKQ